MPNPIRRCQRLRFVDDLIASARSLRTTVSAVVVLYVALDAATAVGGAL